MENKVNFTVKKYNMLTKGDTVVIGLSGGADSCALLHYLVSVKEKYNLKLIACHVNHMIRGQEADRDEEFCRALSCQSPQESEPRNAAERSDIIFLKKLPYSLMPG